MKNNFNEDYIKEALNLFDVSLAEDKAIQKFEENLDKTNQNIVINGHVFIPSEIYSNLCDLKTMQEDLKEWVEESNLYVVIDGHIYEYSEIERIMDMYYHSKDYKNELKQNLEHDE